MARHSIMIYPSTRHSRTRAYSSQPSHHSKPTAASRFPSRKRSTRPHASRFACRAGPRQSASSSKTHRKRCSSSTATYGSKGFCAPAPRSVFLTNSSLALRARPTRPVTRRYFTDRGCWGISESSSPEFFDEPYHFNRVLLPDSADGPIALPAWTDSEPSETPFHVPAAHLALEWIPAGYPEQRQTAQLRPLAEATASRHATRWEFQLPTADDVPDIARSQVGQPKPESWIGRRGPIAAAVVLIIAAVALAILRRRRN